MRTLKADTGFIRETKHLENVIFACFGSSVDRDLPQTPDEEGVIIDLMQCLTGEPYTQVEAHIHHQDGWKE
ncbi:MAG: hypothetical protein IT558_05380 [Alphaproteobacteria bacterium]|nr:hypothetical protein [Alphaproteobacteria bacterium]